MEEKEVDLRDYITMVRKRWKIILVIFLVSTVASGVASFLLPKTYESSAMVKIGTIKNSLLEDPSTVVEIFKTKPVLEKVAEELTIRPTQEKVSELATKIKVRERSGLLEIRGRGETPRGALELVNGVLAVLLKRHEQIFERARRVLEEYFAPDRERLAEMKKEIEALERKIDKLGPTNSEAKAMVAFGYMESLERSRDRYHESQVELRDKIMKESYGTIGTELVVAPTASENPIAPRKKQNMIIAGIFGLFVGFVSAAIVEYFEKPEKVLNR